MLRILLVDDDESLRQLLAVKLKQDLSAVVEQASSGNEAIGMIRLKKDYCIIISDFNMPDGNGKDLQDFLVKENIKSFFFFYTSEKHIVTNPDHLSYLGTIQKPSIGDLLESLVKSICTMTIKKMDWLYRPVQNVNCVARCLLKCTALFGVIWNYFSKPYLDLAQNNTDDKTEKRLKSQISTLSVR